MENANKRKSSLKFDAIPKNTKKAIELLSGKSWLEKFNWYLAGGTALSLYEGHRVSTDLDFFTTFEKFNVEDVLINLNKKEGWEVDMAESRTIYASIYKTQVSFIAYPLFTPEEPFTVYGKINILHPKDIAVMKVIAISQRGKKRDFVDLYWYIKNYESLDNILKRIPHQYPLVKYNYHHILKSLVYFEDAQKDPSLKVLSDIKWKEVKKYFQEETLKIAKDIFK